MARFHVADTVVGEYVLDDPYKPYLHPMRTIGGRIVSLAMPFDHRHHKGLMYALAATDVNWWEEVGSSDNGPVVGVQTQESLAQPSAGTIQQRLYWTAEDGTRATFVEDRTITCAWDAAGFVRWTWTGQFTVLRDVALRHSTAARPDHNGKSTNYHGLGLRFTRTFGWSPSSGAWRNDVANYSADELMGTRPTSVVISDFVDGEYPPRRASVRFTQPTSRHAVFTMTHPFTYFSIGPSVADPIELKRGSLFHERYFVDVVDGNFDARGNRAGD